MPFSDAAPRKLVNYLSEHHNGNTELSDKFLQDARTIFRESNKLIYQ